MKYKRETRRVTILGLIVAVLTTYTMVAAATSAPIGEIVVPQVSNGQPVLVNGEAAATGRTLFNGAQITTSTSGATLNLNRAGKIELAPNSSFTITVEGDAMSGSLATGSLTVLSGKALHVETAQGPVSLSAGESTSTASPTPAPSGKGISPWVWVAIAGGVAAALLIALSSRGNSSTAVASPVR